MAAKKYKKMFNYWRGGVGKLLKISDDQPAFLCDCGSIIYVRVKCLSARVNM